MSVRSGKETNDTLEVKEVDLDKEIDKWWCSQFTDYSMKRVHNHKFIPEPAYTDNFKQSETGKTKIGFELSLDWKFNSNDIEWDSDTIREFAKHFFELGLKTAYGANAVLEEIEKCYEKDDSLCVISHKIISKIQQLKGE